MPAISTRNLVLLPNAKVLRDLLQSMAMLDAILCPEWEYRYYSFNSRWSEGEEMASMRNGQGDDFFALFNTFGCFLKGFVHDTPTANTAISPTQHYHGLPPEFASCGSEPAFKPDDATFCIWRLFGGDHWIHNELELRAGNDPDGSQSLLSPLDGRPETYWQWSEEYYERDVPLHAVKAVYEQQRLTDDLVRTLNPKLCIKDLREELHEINYPV